MGDTLHALPTAAELKRQLGASIDWAVHPEFAGLVRHFSCVDAVVEIPRRGTPAARWRAIRPLRRESYDLAIDLQGLMKSALVTRLARAERRIGPSFQREGARLLYDEVAGARNKNRHAVDECMDVLDFLGLERPERALFPLALPDMHKALAENDAAAANSPPARHPPRVAIAPLSRWRSKNWPLRHFAELARSLSRELGAKLHIVGGKDDRETGEELRRQAGVPMSNHCGQLSLGQTGGLLRLMDAFVSNDSGPMHLAVALGVPSVVMFGPTLPDRTGPYGPGHRVLRADNCKPCHSRTCRNRTHKCMDEISPAMVLDAVKELLP
jgi:lipopolysaccharide heptosyltransferase II